MKLLPGFEGAEVRDQTSDIRFGPIAQLWLERTPDKREVGSSTLPRPTIQGTRSKGCSMILVSCPLNGGVAQLGERLPCTQEVIGSSPFTSMFFDK